MTTTARATFDGKALVFEEPVDLSVDQKYEVRILPVLDAIAAASKDDSDGLGQGHGGALLRLAERLAKLPSDPKAPEDGAEQIDHYLYGLPKRDTP